MVALDRMKSQVRRYPRLWDRLKAVKRFAEIRSDPGYKFLDRFSKVVNRPVIFIQVGANDGLRNDPIREFVVRDKWSGVFVEPIPAVFELLKSNYSYLNHGLHFLCAAVGNQGGGSLEIYAFCEEFLKSLPEEERLNYLRKASCDIEHVKKFVRPQHAQHIVKTTVPVVSLSEIAADVLKTKAVDIVVVDAEGYEEKIIMGIDFKRLNPTAIFFESHHLRKQEQEHLFGYLGQHGYWMETIGGASVAVKAEIAGQVKNAR